MPRQLVKITFQFRDVEPGMRCVGHFSDGSVDYHHWVYEAQQRREKVARADGRGRPRVRDSRIPTVWELPE